MGTRGPKPTITENQVSEIHALSFTHTRIQISEKLGINYDVLCSFIRKMNITCVPDRKNQYVDLYDFWVKNNKHLVLSGAKDGLSAMEISKLHSINYGYTLRLLKEQGFGLLKRGTSKSSLKSQKEKLKSISRDILYEMYVVEGMSIIDIRKKLNVTHKNVKDEMQRHGIEIRTAAETAKLKYLQNPHLIEEARERANNGISGVFRVQKDGKFFDTDIEQKFESWCKERKVEYVKQFQISKGKHKYDFFLPCYNLIVECDGDYWHSSEKQQQKDKLQSQYAIETGYNIVRLKGSEIHDDTFRNIIEPTIERLV